MNGRKKQRSTRSRILSFIMALTLAVSGIPTKTPVVSAVESEEGSPQSEPETAQTRETAGTETETEKNTQTEVRTEESEPTADEEKTESAPTVETESDGETETVRETVETETIEEVTSAEETEEETETATEEILLEAGNSELNSEYYEKLKQKFPPGKYWNNKNGVNNPDGYTDKGCGDHSQGTNNIIDTCNYVYGADNAGEGYVYHYQCRGFSYKLAYDYYGSCPADGTWSKSYDLNSLKAGDIIHYKSNGWPHFIWVTKVEGNDITFADCNMDNHCGIRWDVTDATIKKNFVSNFQYIWVAPADPHPPVPPKPQIHPTDKFGNDFYAYIRFAVNSTYIESENGGENVQTTSGVLQYTYYEPRMIWHFQRAKKDIRGVSYTISNVLDENKTLDVYGMLDNGGNVQLHIKNGGDNQNWYIDDIGGSNFRLVPVYSYADDNKPALFMDAQMAAGFDTLARARNIRACEAATGDGLSQMFRIDIIENYAKPITGYGDDFFAYIGFENSYMEAREVVLQDGAYNVQVSAPAKFAHQPSYDPRQIWHFIRDKGNRQYKDSYKIINEYNGEYLDADQIRAENGMNIQTHSGNDGPNQRWYIIRSTNGLYNLMPVYCYRTDSYPQGLVMDVDGAVTKGGNNVQLWFRNKTAAQLVSIDSLSGFDSDALKNYKKPSAPAAPASVSVSSNRQGTKFSWGAVDSSNLFDRRSYKIDIYKGSSASGIPFIGDWSDTNSKTYPRDELPKGIYTVAVRASNNKYKDLMSAPVTKTFKVGEPVEVGFADTGSQIVQNGKIHLTAANNETAARDVSFVAAAYTASGKMQNSVTLPYRLQSGESTVEISVASLGSSDLMKIFCLDRTTLAPLTDSLIYSENPTASEWVLASDAPAGAAILDEKWTYTETKTETTTSENPSLDGWTRTGSSLQQTGTGTHTYADYPGGFQTDHALYNAYGKSALTAGETDTTKRTVSTASVKDYIYYHWTYNQDPLPNGNYNVFIRDAYGWENGREYYNFRAFESHANYGHTDPNGRNGGDCFYAWNNDPADGSWWWYRFPVYQQTYTDYKKIFTYKKETRTERESATAVTESDTISNVQHWVRYQA